MIDEHEWRSVLQVAKDGTFSLAAKHLFISQPSLSQCIKKIEGELGMQIFDRSKSPLQLTEAGRIYIKAANQMKDLRKNLLSRVDDISELRSGQVRIGSSRTRSVCVLADAMVAFHQRYPNIQLSVVEGSTSRLQEHILQGHVDFSLLYTPLPDTFRTIPLMEERVFVAVPRHHPMVSQYNGVQPLPYPVISFKAFQDEPFIILKPSRCMRTIYDNLCKTTGVKPREVFEGDSVLSAAELCSRGMGATLITDMLIRLGARKEPPFFFALKENIEARQLVAAYGANQHLSKAAQVFLQFIR